MKYTSFSITLGTASAAEDSVCAVVGSVAAADTAVVRAAADATAVPGAWVCEV